MKPAVAGSPASSRPSGHRFPNARASRMPAAEAAKYDRPFALTSPPNKARRLAPEKPIAATVAARMALTAATSRALRELPHASYRLAACP
jgi:hypothetical protein